MIEPIRPGSQPISEPEMTPIAPSEVPNPSSSDDIPSLPERVLLHMPVDIRNVSLVVLAVLASIFALHWAKSVVIPVMLSIVLSYAFSPVVNWAQNKHTPRWLSSAILLLVLAGIMSFTAYSLSGQAGQVVDSLPAAVQKFRKAMRTHRGGTDTPLQTVQKAAEQIEQVARENAAPNKTGAGVTRVVVETPSFDFKGYLWSGTLGLVTLAGQSVVVVFLTYFLMVSGDTFRRKLIKLAGPSLSSKKITLQALDEITVQIQRYLQVQLLTSALVGVLTGIALWIIGLENAAVWGIAAAVFNLVPYVGSLLTAVTSSLVGFLQFGSINMAMVVGGASLFIHTLMGNLITPWLTSRASRMNPVAVFIGLLAWGWLWGVWGLLLGLPILMIVKSVCDRVDDLKPVGEFLGS